MTAKQDYGKYIDETKQKRIQAIENHHNMSEELNKQIKDKQNTQKVCDKDEEIFVGNMKNEYEQWKISEKNKKISQRSKAVELVKNMMAYQKQHDESAKNEIELKRQKERELLNKLSEENIKEKEKLRKKFEAEKELYNQQIQHKLLRESMKKINREKELEYGKRILSEFDQKMVKLEEERIQYRENIYKRAKIQDLRQGLITNVKESENIHNKEFEMRIQKEKEDLDYKYYYNV